MPPRATVWPPAWLRKPGPTAKSVVDAAPEAPKAKEWDSERAAAVLGEALALLDRLERHQADTPARKRVCRLYRQVLADWHRQQDASLWGAPGDMKVIARRWRSERAG